MIPESLPVDLAEAMRTSGLSLSCAESCTGGMAAAAIADVPGASDYFMGGVVAYSNEAKRTLLHVPERTLLDHGAVSEETALAMARGVAAAFGTACAFSVTGIAGPGGGSAEKPVGTVWFGFCVRGSVSAELRVFPGDRTAVRESAAAYALRRMTESVRGVVDRHTIELDNPHEAGVSFP